MSPAMKIANPNNVPFMIHMEVHFGNHTNSRHVCKRKSQNSEGAKGVANEGESDKQERLSDKRLVSAEGMVGSDRPGTSVMENWHRP
jgi:hypothetical protein